MPSNRQEILNLPSLRQLPLSDPDLGGQIDLFLGNMDLDDCTYEGCLKFDSLKVINTPFGWSVAGPLLGHAPTPTLTTAVTPDNLDQDLARLWDLDQVPDSPAAVDDDQVIADF